jgi:hypothetical protein
MLTWKPVGVDATPRHRPPHATCAHRKIGQKIAVVGGSNTGHQAASNITYQWAAELYVTDSLVFPYLWPIARALTEILDKKWEL